MWLVHHTGQVVLIRVWILLQIIHDVSVLVPGENLGESGDLRKYSEKGKNIIVFELLE